MKPSWIIISLVLLVVVLAALILLQNINGPDANAASVRLPIPIIESGQATFYVAQDKGFYADQNLSISFHLGSREQNPAKMVASKQDTFGILGGPDTLLVARSKGHPLKAIAIIHRNSNFPCIITLKDSGLTKLEHLQGKKIGFFYGHISTDVLRNLLNRNKVDYTEVDVGFDYSQLISGQIDAQWAFTVTAGLDLPAKEIDINFIHPEDYGIYTHGYTVFAHEDTIAERPELVERFLRATIRGIEYTVAHPEEANRTIISRNPDLNIELSLARQKMYNSVTSSTAQFPPGYMDYDMWGDTYERLLQEEVIDRELDVRESYTTRFLERIHGQSFD